MDDTGGVSSRQRSGDLPGDVEHVVESQRCTFHPLTQCFAVNKFSCDEVSGISLIDLVDSKEIGMVQR